MTRTPTKLPPIHPGEILNEEFLGPLKITGNRLAKSIGVDARRVRAIILGERSITAEMALLFSRFFGNSAEFWMGIQSQYDLEREQDRLAERLDRIPGYYEASPMTDSPDVIPSCATPRASPGAACLRARRSRGSRATPG